MKIVERKPDDLIAAEYNPRTLSDDQFTSISDSLKRFGFVDPVLVNKHPDRMDIIIGGHQRTKVAKSLDMETIPTVELSLNLEQEKELNIRLNKNTGSFDMDALNEFFEVDDLIEWGFDADELEFFEPEEELEVEEDDFDEEPPEEPKTELGRIYQLGNHRLMCGDSTSEEDVKRKMGRDEDHATKKPMELCVRGIRHGSKKNNIILDLFGGSGSTLIAADQSKRQCRMMELDPKYCDVIVKRYCKLKDIDPETVFETGVAK